jgi:hypothetical protein
MASISVYLPLSINPPVFQADSRLLHNYLRLIDGIRGLINHCPWKGWFREQRRAEKKTACHSKNNSKAIVMMPIARFVTITTTIAVSIISTVFITPSECC